jgi:hypothetical protein
MLVLSVGVFGALANLPLDNPLFREVVARFFLMPHLVLCVAAGLALSKRDPRIAMGLAGALAVAGFVQRPQHDALSVRNYGLALLDQPEGALVLTQGDLISNSTRALQACAGAKPGHEVDGPGSQEPGLGGATQKEGVKPTLQVIDQQLLSYSWYTARLRRAWPGLAIPAGARWHPSDPDAFRLNDLLTLNAQRPLILCGGLKEGEAIRFRMVPWGLCERLIPLNEAFDAERWFAESEARLPSLEWTNAKAPRGSWEERVRRDVWHARAQRGLTALTVGIERNNDGLWLTRAYEILRQCSELDEAPQPPVFKNLGIAAGRLGKTAEMKTALRRYLEVAPASDPELPTIRALSEI